MAEIVDRYVEQLQTTVETMRRRCVAYYDDAIGLGTKAAAAAERTRDIAEPVYYDVRDYTRMAMADVGPIECGDKEARNSMVEFYLGISVLAIGLGAGELCGAHALGPLLERVFDPTLELAVFVLLPVYCYMSLRKSAAMDDGERRVFLFTLISGMGILAGHLFGHRLVSLVPSTFFLLPMIFALLLDGQLFPSPFPGRVPVYGIAAGVSVVAAALCATLPLGYLSWGVIVMAVVHAGLLVGHFQLIQQLQRDKLFNIGEAQLGYALALLLLQLPICIVYGTSY